MTLSSFFFSFLFSHPSSLPRAHPHPSTTSKVLFFCFCSGFDYTKSNSRHPPSPTKHCQGVSLSLRDLNRKNLQSSSNESVASSEGTGGSVMNRILIMFNSLPSRGERKEGSDFRLWLCSFCMSSNGLAWSDHPSIVIHMFRAECPHPSLPSPFPCRLFDSPVFLLSSTSLYPCPHSPRLGLFVMWYYHHHPRLGSSTSLVSYLRDPLLLHQHM